MAAKNSNEISQKKSRKLLVSVIIIAALACMFIAVQIAANYIAETKLKEFVTGLGAPYPVSWSKVRYKLWKRQLEITNFTVGDAKADMITIPKITNGPSAPKYIAISIKNFSIPVNEDFLGKHHVVFGNMGYRYFTGFADLTASLGDDNRLDFAISNMTIAEVGAADIKMTIGEIYEQSIPSIVRAISDKTVTDMWVIFEDKGFANRVIDLFAITTNTPRDRAKARALNGLNRRVHTQLIADSEQRRSLAQLYRFFDNPNRLTLQLSDGQTDVLVKDIFQPNATGWRSLTEWFTNLSFNVTAN